MHVFDLYSLNLINFKQLQYLVAFNLSCLASESCLVLYLISGSIFLVFERGKMKGEKRPKRI